MVVIGKTIKSGQDLFTNFLKRGTKKVRLPGTRASPSPSLKKIPSAVDVKINRRTPSIAVRGAKGAAVVGGTTLALGYGGGALLNYFKDVGAKTDAVRQAEDYLDLAEREQDLGLGSYGLSGDGYSGGYPKITEGAMAQDANAESSLFPLFLIAGLAGGGIYLATRKKKKSK